MKKNKLLILLLCLLVIAAGAFTACGSKQEETSEPEATETKVLSDSELIDIAFNDAGFDSTAASDIKLSEAVESGTRNVSFKIGDAEYSYDIDVNSGEIVNCVKPDVAPDVAADPVDLAMNEVEKLPEFEHAENINAKSDGTTITVTFDSEGESYEYKYDIESATLEKVAP